MPERIAIFWDLAATEQAFRNFGAQVDYLGLRDYLAEDRLLVEAFVYLPINPYHPDSKKEFIDFLWTNGFFVRSKIGKPRPDHKWKCGFEVEIAVDILNFIHQARVDIVVLVTGDGDLREVCEAARNHGVRCEIASTGQCVAGDLLDVANGYIDLGTIIREQLEQQNETGSECASGTVPEHDEPESESHRADFGDE